jgi:hypothetical protein
MGDSTDANEAAPARRRSFALPRLGGRRSTLFQLVWCAALLLTLVAMAVGNHRSYVRSTERPFSHVGMGWYEDQGELRLRQPFGAEAIAAGIKRGDRIVAIDGAPVGSDLGSAAEIDRRLKGPEGSTVALSVRSEDGRVATHRLTRTKRNVDAAFAGSGLTSDAYSWMVLVTNILPDLFLLAAAVMLFRGRREEPVCALLSLSLLLMVTSGGGAWSFWEGALLSKLRMGLAIVSALGLTAGLLAFPDGRLHSRWSLAILAAAFLWAPIAWFLPQTPAVSLAWIGLLGAAVAVLAHRYRRLADGLERQQIRWVLLGFAWGAILLVVSALFGMVERATDDRAALDIWAGFADRVIGSFGVGCFAGGLLVSLLRYRLYDVDAVISRSAAYGLLTAGFVAVFAGSQKVIESLGENLLVGGSGPLSGGLAAAIGAAAVVPLHNRMLGWAERRFQKALIHLRRDLPECVEDLRETAGLPEIAGEVVERAAAGVRASRAAMIVDGRLERSLGASPEEVGEWCRRSGPDSSVASLDCDTSDPLFPMRVPLRARHAAPGEPLGWLLLGPRPDGSFYGSDEREALAEIADPVARALRVVRLRDERDARLTRFVEERIAALEARLPRPRRRPAAAAAE